MSSGNGRNAALRLIDQLLRLAGPGAELVEAIERPWASATFAGARHIVTLTLPLATSDDPVPPWIASIGEHGFTLPRAFVADAIASAEPSLRDDNGQWYCRCTIELLTVDDDIS